MRKTKLKLPDWAGCLWEPYRFIGLHGGRAGAKSRSVGTYLPLVAAESKKRILCAREVQLTIKQSSKRLIEMQIDRMNMRNQFKITEREIIHLATGSEFIFMGLRDQDPDKIKSLESIDIVWVEEAHTISQNSMKILHPTIRNDNSKIIYTWNDRSKDDAVSQFFVENEPPSNSFVLKVGWEDNPFFPEVLREEMEHCKRTDLATYAHVWGGGYMTITEGSYYAQEMLAVHNEGRLRSWDLQDVNDHNGVCVAWDLGRNDYTSMWFYKFIGADEIHIIDFYENKFEHIEHYINVLKSKPYTYHKQIMPHDAKNKHLEAIKSSYEYVKDAGFDVEVLKVTKSVLDDIEAVRRILPLCHFYKPHCEKGTDHLMAYRRKKNATTGIYEEFHVHDEASHAADAFRQMARKHPLNAKTRAVKRKTLGGL